MQQTENLGLKKIQGTDDWRNLIDTYYNDSMDTIDSTLGRVRLGIRNGAMCIIYNAPASAEEEETEGD